MHHARILLGIAGCLSLVLAACAPAAPAPTATFTLTATLAPSATPVPTATAAPTSSPAPTATLTPTSPPTRTPRATVTPFQASPTPFLNEFGGSVILDGNKTTYTCKGTGSPTILLENGLDYMTFGSPIFYKITRTCLIMRPGLLGEEVQGPRTTLDQVVDLHDSMQRAGITGPYILVGHSIAGFNLLLYTSLYPTEVLGMVCADCRYPFLNDIFLEKLKPAFAKEPNPEEAARSYASQKFGIYEAILVPDQWKTFKEKLDIYTSAQQALKVKSLGNRPVVALVAEKSNTQPVDVKNDLLYKAAWDEAALKFSQLTTQGRMQIVSGRDHTSILRDEALELAVREVYEKVKGGAVK